MKEIEEIYLRELIDLDYLQVWQKFIIAIKLGYTNRKDIIEYSLKREYSAGAYTKTFTKLLSDYINLNKGYELTLKSEIWINELFFNISPEYYKYNIRKENDKIIGTYDNNNLAFIYEKKENNKLTGDYITYHYNGDIKTNAYYINGKIEGNLYINYENEKKKLSAKYIEGFLSDQKIKYYENGNIENIINYQDGKGIKEGFIKEFYENGDIKEEGYYQENRLFKEYREYYLNNKQKSIYNYNRHGEKDNNYYLFYENGNIKEEGYYKGNYLQGELKKYYKNGWIKSIKKYDSESSIPISEEFFEDPEKIKKEQEKEIKRENLKNKKENKKLLKFKKSKSKIKSKNIENINFGF